MTDASDTKIHKIVIDDAYQESALKRIRQMTDGNGISEDELKIIGFEGEVLQFQAEIIADVVMTINKRTEYGRVQGSMVLDSEHAAKLQASKEYLALRQDRSMIDKIRNIIIALPNKGFGKGGMKIPLNFFRKSFVTHQPCPSCKKAGHLPCKRCGGSGTQNCGRCYGSGYCSCHNCNGATTIYDSNRGTVPCPICNGRGKVSCPPCRQTGRISCGQCAGKGNIRCSTCNGLSYMSVIQEMMLEVNTKFDYPKEKLPANVVTLIEKDKDKLAESAQIQVLPFEVDSVVNKDDEAKKEEQIKAEQEKYFRVPVLYDVVLPYSNLTFEIRQKTYYAFLFGVKGNLVHVSPFLDDLLGEAQRKIQDAADGRGDLTESLKTVASYRTGRDALLLGLRHAPNKAANMLKKKNQVGLSNGKAKLLATLADTALRNLTRRIRWLGVAAGQIFCLSLFAAYFLTPLRQMVFAQIGAAIPEVAVDLLCCAFISYLGATVIQAIIGISIKKSFSQIMPAGEKISTNVRLGKEALTHYGLCAVWLVILVECSRHWAQAPEWYYQILSMIL